MSLLPAFLRPAEFIWEPAPRIYTLLAHPVTTLFTFVYDVLVKLRGAPYRPPPHAPPIRITCISDSHDQVPAEPLPPGDLLIHAGDLTDNGTIADIQKTIDWLKTQLTDPSSSSSTPGYTHIVVVCGNHDSYFDQRSRSVHDRKSQRQLSWGRIHYLEHSSVTLDFAGGRQLRVYGAPQIPRCGAINQFAFQYEEGADAWSGTVPGDVDVLVTHSPPKWHLDLPNNGGLGCEWLLKEAWRVRPTLHVFGHIHASRGVEAVWWDGGQRALEDLRALAFAHLRVGATVHGQLLLVAELVNVKLWLAGVRLLVEGVKGVLWTRAWGGTVNGGYMVNAALMYRSTGKILNKPQTVVL